MTIETLEKAIELRELISKFEADLRSLSNRPNTCEYTMMNNFAISSGKTENMKYRDELREVIETYLKTQLSNLKKQFAKI